MKKFHSINIEGFSSIRDNFVFHFESSGFHLIRGACGSGKTTMWNALFWCLYGKNIKGLNKESLQTKKAYRTDLWRGTRVIVNFYISENLYTVARHIKFKGSYQNIKGNDSLLLFVNNEITDLKGSDVQSEIIRILGINHKVFLNSIMFGQKMDRFGKAKGEEKRKIFEGMVNIDFVDSARFNASEQCQELTTQLAENQAAITLAESQKDTVKIQLDTLIYNINNFENQKASDIAQIEQKIQKYILEFQNLILIPEGVKQSTEEIDIMIDTANQYQRELSTQQLAYKHLIERLNSLTAPKTLKEHCNTCGTKLDTNQLAVLQETYNKELANYNINVQGLQSQQQNISNTIQQLTEIIAQLKIEDLQDKRNQILESNAECQRNINANFVLRNRRAELKTQMEVGAESIEELKKRKFVPKHSQEELQTELNSWDETLQELHTISQEINRKLQLYRWWKDVGFTNKGIKGFLMNTALSLLNSKAKKYAAAVGITIRFSIDTSKSSKPFVINCTNNGVDYLYEEFSGGETSILDAITALALHDLINANNPFNIFICDELFEHADSKYIDDICVLLRSKAEICGLYVITHSLEIDSTNVKLIKFLKENGNTYIER